MKARWMRGRDICPDMRVRLANSTAVPAFELVAAA